VRSQKYHFDKKIQQNEEAMEEKGRKELDEGR